MHISTERPTQECSWWPSLEYFTFVPSFSFLWDDGLPKIWFSHGQAGAQESRGHLPCFLKFHLEMIHGISVLLLLAKARHVAKHLLSIYCRSDSCRAFAPFQQCTEVGTSSNPSYRWRKGYLGKWNKFPRLQDQQRARSWVHSQAPKPLTLSQVRRSRSGLFSTCTAITKACGVSWSINF